MDGYGQFCPIAKAAEVFDRRWTLLVLRELVAGSNRFNDIHRGVPRMSRTLLSKRLSQLQTDGLVERRETEDGPVYELTDAGRDLEPVLEAIGAWGVRYVNSLTDQDLDPAFLMWDLRRSVDPEALPEGQTVLELTFRGLEPELRDWWLLLSPEEVDVCDEDPGFPTDVSIETHIRSFVRIWRGELGWNDALRDRTLRLRGPARLRREVPGWFRLSTSAAPAYREASVRSRRQADA